MTILALALAGCGAAADVPENIPQRGVWRRDASVTRVSVNGLTLEGNQVPVALPADVHEELGCIEPVLRTLADFRQVVAERSKQQCELEALTHVGASIGGNGRCAFGKDGSMGGRFTLLGDEHADIATLHTTADVFVRAPSGSADQARVTSRIVWKRLGDC